MIFIQNIKIGVILNPAIYMIKQRNYDVNKNNNYSYYNSNDNSWKKKDGWEEPSNNTSWKGEGGW